MKLKRSRVRHFSIYQLNVEVSWELFPKTLTVDQMKRVVAWFNRCCFLLFTWCETLVIFTSIISIAHQRGFYYDIQRFCLVFLFHLLNQLQSILHVARRIRAWWAIQKWSRQCERIKLNALLSNKTMNSSTWDRLRSADN